MSTAPKVRTATTAPTPPVSKTEKFAKLANKRVSKALDAIGSIGDLARIKGGYTTVEVAKISEALNAEFDAMEKSFADALNGGTKQTKFSL